MAVVQDHRQLVSNEGNDRAKGLARRPVAPSSAPRRVLVIEDDWDAAESLRDALELGNHVVLVASSGLEAIEKARAFEPDVVICDIGLPGMDGYDVARTLRSDPALRRTPLVALTGYEGPEDVANATRAGFDVHLAKPPSIDALERAIAEATGGSGGP